MAIEYKAGYTYTNGETQTVTKANAAQTARTIECATNKLLGRSTAGTGAIEEIDCTAAGRALLDDTDAAAQRATLGVPATSEVLLLANNLSDLADLEQARINLGVGSVRAVSGSNLAVTSSTTPVDIPDLALSVTSGITYTIKSTFRVNITSASNPDFVLKLTGTATASAFSGVFVNSRGSIAVKDADTVLGSTVIMGINTPNVTHVVSEITLVCNGSGTLKWQFAQGNPSGSAATVYAGATMEISSFA